MITRRAFLIGSAATVTLSLVDKFYTFIENHGEPLIEAPKNPSRILYAFPDRDYQLGLDGDPWVIDFPYKNWLEYIVGDCGYETPTKLSDFREICWNYGLTPSQLREPVPDDQQLELVERKGPHADAFHLLDCLEIGPDLDVEGQVVGGLKFYDGPMPGSNYLAVHTEDDISVSILQHRLNQLGQNIKVELSN
jgi:hypothetical protein